MGTKILIVDDNEDLRTLYTLFFESAGFEVFEAHNGQEAIDIYIEKQPDIVIMDIRMPVMNGVEATKRIKEIDKNAIIIGATAYHDGCVKEIIEAGAIVVLEKPFPPEKMLEIIKKYLNIK